MSRQEGLELQGRSALLSVRRLSSPTPSSTTLTQDSRASHGKRTGRQSLPAGVGNAVRRRSTGVTARIEPEEHDAGVMKVENEEIILKGLVRQGDNRREEGASSSGPFSKSEAVAGQSWSTEPEAVAESMEGASTALGQSTKEQGSVKGDARPVDGRGSPEGPPSEELSFSEASRAGTAEVVPSEGASRTEEQIDVSGLVSIAEGRRTAPTNTELPDIVQDEGSLLPKTLLQVSILEAGLDHVSDSAATTAKRRSSGNEASTAVNPKTLPTRTHSIELRMKKERLTEPPPQHRDLNEPEKSSSLLQGPTSPEKQFKGPEPLRKVLSPPCSPRASAAVRTARSLSLPVTLSSSKTAPAEASPPIARIPVRKNAAVREPQEGAASPNRAAICESPASPWLIRSLVKAAEALSPRTSLQKPNANKPTKPSSIRTSQNAPRESSDTTASGSLSPKAVPHNFLKSPTKVPLKSPTSVSSPTKPRAEDPGILSSRKLLLQPPSTSPIKTPEDIISPLAPRKTPAVQSPGTSNSQLPQISSPQRNSAESPGTSSSQHPRVTSPPKHSGESPGALSPPRVLKRCSTLSSSTESEPGAASPPTSPDSAARAEQLRRQTQLRLEKWRLDQEASALKVRVWGLQGLRSCRFTSELGSKVRSCCWRSGGECDQGEGLKPWGFRVWFPCFRAS
jgi:hypothetical protein